MVVDGPALGAANKFCCKHWWVYQFGKLVRSGSGGVGLDVVGGGGRGGTEHGDNLVKALNLIVDEFELFNVLGVGLFVRGGSVVGRARGGERGQSGQFCDVVLARVARGLESSCNVVLVTHRLRTQFSVVFLRYLKYAFNEKRALKSEMASENCVLQARKK